MRGEQMVPTGTVSSLTGRLNHSLSVDMRENTLSRNLDLSLVQTFRLTSHSQVFLKLRCFILHTLMA